MSGFEQFKALMEMLKINFNNPLIAKIIYESAIDISNEKEITLEEITETLKELHDDFEEKITLLKKEFTPQQIELIIKTFKND